jgi:5-methylcytosine-specific restriction endonuclease McrA
MDNLVTACRPCNLMKGTRLFPTLEEAKKYVLARRQEWQQKYHEDVKSQAS